MLHNIRDLICTADSTKRNRTCVGGARTRFFGHQEQNSNGAADLFNVTIFTQGVALGWDGNAPLVLRSLVINRRLFMTGPTVAR